MRITRPSLLALATILCLSGCDVLENIPRTPEEMMRASSPFGLPTRELVEETPQGKVYRLTVQSKRPASWTQADFAMWEEFRSHCPDGERYEMLSAEPATDESHADILRELPAGTLFVRVLRCPPKPPYEFEFERRVPHAEALALMRQRLGEAERASGGRVVVQAILPTSHVPKYQQVEKIFGLTVLATLPECPSGVQVTHPQIGMFAASAEPPDRDHAAGYLGYIVRCAPSDSAAATPETGADG